MYLKQKCQCGAEFEVDDGDKVAQKGVLAIMNDWEEKHESICDGMTSKIKLQSYKVERSI